MKLKSITQILTIAAALGAAVPVNASWFGNIRDNGDTVNSSRISGMTANSANNALLSTISARKTSENSVEADSAADRQDTDVSTKNISHAESVISVSEPSNLLMLGLGIAGLIAGRYAAKRRKKNT